MIVSFALALCCLGAFAVSFARDRRRLRNGVFLVPALFFGLSAVLDAMDFNAFGTWVKAVVVFAVIALGPLCVAALAVFLVLNGVTMLRREGRRLGNLLSLLLGLAMIGYAVLGVLALVLNWFALFATLITVGLVVGYVSFLFACYLVYSLIYLRIPNRRADFVMVLGSGLLNGKVPPLLASRLDRARQVFEALRARGGAPMIITSGGKGPDEPVPESHAMAEYLVAAGVPRDRILLEDRSRTTAENMRFSDRIMRAAVPDYRCLVVTNNFHAFRAALLARVEGVSGEVVGSPTAAYYWPSATIREFVAIFRDRWKINLPICAVLALAEPVLLAVS
ncbi:YdcF family protein [Saccharopolyspora rosea]|uniref:YdcF family protein n=1 Tax=Saccharopolyspora rosea TaxID=524884 RepID=A0ABW3FRE6_9PSEU|nr:YdcF family protein [Saccharopolyspora rosea]